VIDKIQSSAVQPTTRWQYYQISEFSALGNAVRYSGTKLHILYLVETLTFIAFILHAHSVAFKKLVHYKRTEKVQGFVNSNVL
jgi:hypothetical protein